MPISFAKSWTQAYKAQLTFALIGIRNQGPGLMQHRFNMVAALSDEDSTLPRLHQSFKPIQRKTFLVSGMLGRSPNLTALKAVSNTWSLRTWRHVTHAFLPSVGDFTQVIQQNSTMEVLSDSSPLPPSQGPSWSKDSRPWRRSMIEITA